VQAGDVVSGAFDSLLAKLIVTGASREDALERARRALDEFEVAGLPTVLPFHRAVVRDEAFAPSDGGPFSVYTRWIETEFVNGIEPWTGELGSDATAGPEKRQGVVVEVGGKRVEVSLPQNLFRGAGGSAAAEVAPAPRRRGSGSVAAAASGNSVKSPMQATVVKVAVAEGDTVVKGDLIVVLEAMKMEQPLTAHRDGTIANLAAEVGSTVSSGHVLLEIA
jgi:acetyl-CoA/propionyl-CoA carboxylase biotin carboxyl carrier protein